MIQRARRGGSPITWGALLALGSSIACTSAPEPRVRLPYEQDFSGSELPSELHGRGGGWQIVNSALFNDGAHNVPLWLAAELPADVRIDFTARSESPGVDIKFEVFGDGVHHTSGYVVIFSGWNNTRSIIARLDEHGPLRSAAEATAIRQAFVENPEHAAAAHRDSRAVVSRPHRAEPGVPYRFRFERRGEDLTLYVNEIQHLQYFDPAPLKGPGHDRFAFNNWASKVTFDDLRIEAL